MILELGETAVMLRNVATTVPVCHPLNQKYAVPKKRMAENERSDSLGSDTGH